MSRLWPLVLLAGAFFIWNSKSCNLPVQQAKGPPTQVKRDESSTGSPVRQWEHEVTDQPAREAALPQAGGLNARTMLDGARQGLQRPQ